MKNTFLAFYLALKEVLRNRGRFLLVSMVIALITLLVLFIAALGEGLANGNLNSAPRPPLHVMPPAICPHCGAQVPTRAKACPECGADGRFVYVHDRRRDTFHVRTTTCTSLRGELLANAARQAQKTSLPGDAAHRRA